MKYNFPKIKFVDNNTYEEQRSHLFSEILEAAEEIANGNTEAAMLEITDAVHSYESLTRKDEHATRSLINKTIIKNVNRGYYDGR